MMCSVEHPVCTSPHQDGILDRMYRLIDSSGSANLAECNELLKDQRRLRNKVRSRAQSTLCKADATTGHMRYTSGSPMSSNGRPDKLCPRRQLA